MTTNTTSVQRGIPFLMAKWSGQSQWAYEQLTDFLGKHDGTLENLICLDIDREKDAVSTSSELAGKIHGYGEAAVPPHRANCKNPFIWPFSVHFPTTPNFHILNHVWSLEEIVGLLA